MKDGIEIIGCELCGSSKHTKARCSLLEYMDIIQETENVAALGIGEQDDAPVDAEDAGDRLFLMVSVAVKRERVYQDNKYGEPNHILTWIAVMEQELAEARQAFFGGQWRDAMMEILQVTAVGFAAMEQHGIFERPELRGMAALTASHLKQVFDDSEK